MDGRAFLAVAKELVQGATEAHWRAAAGRAYYALMLEGWATLLRWGLVIPARESIHNYVRLRFRYATDVDLRKVGDELEWIGRLRNQADYQPTITGPFKNALRVSQAILGAEDSLVRIDQVDTDSTRRAAAIAGIRARWP
jgi:hypothetical protein